MKRSEIIAMHYGKIIDAMTEHYRYVLNSDGRIQYKVYIWEDGELEYLYGVQGDNGWLQPKECEPRELFYVCTIDAPGFDPWDIAENGAPDDETARAEEREEIIEYVMDNYNAEEILDSIIESAEFDEKLELY